MKTGKYPLLAIMFCSILIQLNAQQVNVVKVVGQQKINVLIGKQLFTSFLFPDTLEKPVLYPINASNGVAVTRGFPLAPQPGDPTDHPHHIGLWFNFENVNGLDFWNNSYAIAKEKKHLYGWIKTDSIWQIKSGKNGVIVYHANWTDEANNILLFEKTTYTFKAIGHQYIIDRTTVLQANTEVLFKDAKDGLLGLRVAHQLQIPTEKELSFTDDKGNVTKVNSDASTSTGNYITSEGNQGNDAWSTRARWCKMFGKINNDSVSIVIIDHPQNPNYPTFWHARGYGLFAANPLGENIFTNGKSTKNLQLKKGESITFQYRVVIDNNTTSISNNDIEKLVKDFTGNAK